MVQHIPRLNFKKMSLPELQLWLIQKYIPHDTGTFVKVTIL